MILVAYETSTITVAVICRKEHELRLKAKRFSMNRQFSTKYFFV